MDKISNVAIIMDGNGRWAQSRSRPRFFGHVRGAHIVSEITETASNLGLNSLTLYAFSTENKNRPNFEIEVLFKILDKFLVREKSKILNNAVQFKVIGDYSFLSQKTLEKISELEDLTKGNDGLKLRFAFGYGARSELVRASKLLSESGLSFTEENFSKFLYDDVEEIDLLIRTGGDFRVSNFLLWQIAYSELFFSNSYWPDFTSAEFIKILNSTENRERRFGLIPSQALDDLSSIQIS